MQLVFNLKTLQLKPAVPQNTQAQKLAPALRSHFEGAPTWPETGQELWCFSGPIAVVLGFGVVSAWWWLSKLRFPTYGVLYEGSYMGVPQRDHDFDSFPECTIRVVQGFTVEGSGWGG